MSTLTFSSLRTAPALPNSIRSLSRTPVISSASVRTCEHKNNHKSKAQTLKSKTDIVLTRFKFQMRKLEKYEFCLSTKDKKKTSAHRVHRSEGGALVHALVGDAVAVEHLHLEATLQLPLPAERPNLDDTKKNGIFYQCNKF